MSAYAVYNKDCGHVLGVHNDRAAHAPLIARLEARGNFSLRTRKATDEDMLAVIRVDRCELCTVPNAASAHAP
jgi:hypothetical protein